MNKEITGLLLIHILSGKMATNKNLNREFKDIFQKELSMKLFQKTKTLKIEETQA